MLWIALEIMFVRVGDFVKGLFGLLSDGVLLRGKEDNHGVGHIADR